MNVSDATRGSQPAQLTVSEDAITLDKLCAELKITPRDARMLLRLAAKQKDKFPNLAKDHFPRQPWQWAPDSKALAEAKKALSANAS